MTSRRALKIVAAITILFTTTLNPGISFAGTTGGHSLAPLGHGAAPAVTPMAPIISMVYEGLYGGIYVANIDGSGAVRVRVNGTSPEVSSDGSLIAFEQSGALWTMNIDGSGATQIATGVTAASSSADATKLVGVRGGSLVVIDRATHAVTAVPNSSGEEFPVFSPDGLSIAAGVDPLGANTSAVHSGPGWSTRTPKPYPNGPYSPDGTMVLSVYNFQRMAANPVDGRPQIALQDCQCGSEGAWSPKLSGTTLTALDSLAFADPSEIIRIIQGRPGSPEDVVVFGGAGPSTANPWAPIGYTLTTAISPATAVYPQKVTITGTLRKVGSAAPVAGARVELYRRAAQSFTVLLGPFTFVGTVTTGADGSYSATQIPGRPYEYQVRYNPTNGNARAVDQAFVKVTPTIANIFSASTAKAGSKVALQVTTTPATRALKTYLQRRVGSRAVTVGPHNTDSSGAEVFLVTVPAKGATAYYRVSTAVSPVSAGKWVPITGT